MASKAHHSRSAAVEFALDEWEIVAKRLHYVMQEDGSIVLVDPSTHLVMSNDEIQQEAAPIQSNPLEDTDAPAAEQLAPVNSDQLDWLLSSLDQSSNAADFLKSQWEIVTSNAHHIMNEDGSFVLVDPSTRPVMMSSAEIKAAAPIQLFSSEDTDAPAVKQLAPVNTDLLDWLWPFDQSPEADAAYEPMLSSIVADIKAEVNEQLDFSCFDLPFIVINNEQKKIDLADFDAMKKTKKNEAAAVGIKTSGRQAKEFGNETIVYPVTVNTLGKTVLSRFEEASVSAAQPKVASAQTGKHFMVPTAASTAKRTSKFVAEPVNQGPAWNSTTKIDPKAYQKLPSVSRSYIMKRQQKAIEVGQRSSPALP